MTKFVSRSPRFNPFAAEGTGTLGAKGVAPSVGQDETDPDWQPM
jgi:hypothetical protein